MIIKYQEAIQCSNLWKAHKTFVLAVLIIKNTKLSIKDFRKKFKENHNQHQATVDAQVNKFYWLILKYVSF